MCVSGVFGIWDVGLLQVPGKVFARILCVYKCNMKKLSNWRFTVVQSYQTATGVTVEMTNGKCFNVGVGTRQTGPLPSVKRSAFV